MVFALGLAAALTAAWDGLLGYGLARKRRVLAVSFAT